MYVISRTKKCFAFLKEEEGKKDDDDDGRRKKYAREDKKKEREFLSIYIYINARFFLCARVSAFAFLSSRERASGSLVGFSASSDDDEKISYNLRSFRRRRRNDRGRL